MELSRNAVHAMVSNPTKPPGPILLQVLSTSAVNASKISSKMKLSDGRSWVHAMILEAVVRGKKAFEV
jgi:hypothetical protein